MGHIDGRQDDGLDEVFRATGLIRTERGIPPGTLPVLSPAAGSADTGFFGSSSGYPELIALALDSSVEVQITVYETCVGVLAPRDRPLQFPPRLLGPYRN